MADVHPVRRQYIALLLRPALFLSLAQVCALAQEKPAAPQPQSVPDTAASRAPPASPAAGPAHISLSKPIELARANSTVYQAALTEAGSAHEDRTQARDALLPQVTYNNQYLYTQPNQLGDVRFIANNAVHEYVSQGNVHESIDVAAVAAYRGG